MKYKKKITIFILFIFLVCKYNVSQNDPQFDEFWLNFKKAVLNNDEEKLKLMIHFPFQHESINWKESINDFVELKEKYNGLPLPNCDLINNAIIEKEVTLSNYRFEGSNYLPGWNVFINLKGVTYKDEYKLGIIYEDIFSNPEVVCVIDFYFKNIEGSYYYYKNYTEQYYLIKRNDSYEYLNLEPLPSEKP